MTFTILLIEEDGSYKILPGFHGSNVDKMSTNNFEEVECEDWNENEAKGDEKQHRSLSVLYRQFQAVSLISTVRNSKYLSSLAIFVSKTDQKMVYIEEVQQKCDN